MRPLAAIAVLLAALQSPAAPETGLDTASGLAAAIRAAEIDPDACYRVREIRLRKDAVSFYLNDGYLAFAKPVSGRRLFAVFHAPEDGDDGELLLRPPDRGERASLARFTESANLSEHFKHVVFILTDGSAEELEAQIRQSGPPQPEPERGLLMAQQFNLVLRNLGESFQVRVVHDVLSGNIAAGMMYAAVAGNTLGNFDVLFDPSAQEQIIVGQVRSDGGVPGFNVWASFETRARRQRGGIVRPPVRLTDYRIDSVLEPDLSLSSVTRAVLTAEVPVRGAVTFEIAPAMAIDRAMIDGLAVEVFRRESLRSNLIGNRSNEPFLLVLREPLVAGRRYEVEFRHSGKVITPAGNQVFFVGARTNWYPVHSTTHSTFDLRFRVPKRLTVVAAGDQVEDREEGEDRIVRWRTQVPVRVAGFNLGEYDKVTVRRSGLTVSVYANRAAESALASRQQVILLPPAWSTRGLRRSGDLVTFTAPPPDPQARLAQLADEISSALEWMSIQFAPPPLKTLTVSPIPGSFGQGFPGLLYLSTLSFLDEKDRPVGARNSSVQLFYSEILHAHEVAHQWWGNLVVPATYHDDWTSEGLANYCALMVLERKKGAHAIESALDESLRNLRVAYKGKPIEQAGPIAWGIRLRANAGLDPWRVITYDKGSWIFHMLRRRMGDSRFFSMLGELARRYAHSTITTDQFRRLAAEFSPSGLPDPTLENFFEQWVLSTGIPTLEMKTSVSGKAPNVQLSVTVKQSGVGEDFSVDVPVQITLPAVKTPLVRWVRTSSEPETLRVRLKAAPTRVELAPGRGILAQRD